MAKKKPGKGKAKPGGTRGPGTAKEWGVQGVLGMRGVQRGSSTVTEFEVKWVGYKKTTWGPSENINEAGAPGRQRRSHAPRCASDAWGPGCVVRWRCGE